MSPLTAAEVAARTPVPHTHTPPAAVGSADGVQVMVSAAELAATLRGLVDSGSDVRHHNGWWTLDAFGGLISVGAENFDQLAVVAVNALRAQVETEDPRGKSAAPVAWLVRLSSDEQLRSWLHIPHADV